MNNRPRPLKDPVAQDIEHDSKARAIALRAVVLAAVVAYVCIAATVILGCTSTPDKSSAQARLGTASAIRAVSLTGCALLNAECIEGGVPQACDAVALACDGAAQLLYTAIRPAEGGGFTVLYCHIDPKTDTAVTKAPDGGVHVRPVVRTTTCRSSVAELLEAVQ